MIKEVDRVVPRAYPCTAEPPVMDQASILNGIKTEILREKRAELVKYLNPERHFDFLRSKCVLSGQDCQEIGAQVTREKSASMFLDKLQDHGPAAYERLCESLLRERTQLFLLKMLNMEYENRMNNMKVLFQPDTSRETEAVLAVNPGTLPTPNQLSQDSSKASQEN